MCYAYALDTLDMWLTTDSLLHFTWGIPEATCIEVTAVCVSVCLSVPRCIPTLLHGSGCNLGELYGMPSSCAPLGRFAICVQVSLVWQHIIERKMSASASTRSMPGILSALPANFVQRHFRDFVCIYICMHWMCCMVETEGVIRRHTTDFKSSLGVRAAGDAQTLTDVFTGIFLHYWLNHQRSIVDHWEPTVVVVCKHQLLQQPVQYVNWSMNVGRGCHSKWLVGWLTDGWIDGRMTPGHNSLFKNQFLIKVF